VAASDPETFSELIDAFYQVCGEAISRRNGFVVEYLGDGVLALFGYPRLQRLGLRCDRTGLISR
jgi:class 3 adenylate cyclase